MYLSISPLSCNLFIVSFTDYVTNTLGISDATQLKKIPDLMLELQNGKIDVIVTGKAVAQYLAINITSFL